MRRKTNRAGRRLRLGSRAAPAEEVGLLTQGCGSSLDGSRRRLGKQRGRRARSALPRQPPDPPHLLPAAPGSCRLLHDTLPFLPSLGAAGRSLGSGTQAVCQPWYLTPLVLLCGCR